VLRPLPGATTSRTPAESPARADLVDRASDKLHRCVRPAGDVPPGMNSVAARRMAAGTCSVPCPEQQPPAHPPNTLRANRVDRTPEKGHRRVRLAEHAPPGMNSAAARRMAAWTCSVPCPEQQPPAHPGQTRRPPRATPETFAHPGRWPWTIRHRRQSCRARRHDPPSGAAPVPWAHAAGADRMANRSPAAHSRAAARSRAEGRSGSSLGCPERFIDPFRRERQGGTWSRRAREAPRDGRARASAERPAPGAQGRRCSGSSRGP